jgi:hypothetical protein
MKIPERKLTQINQSVHCVGIQMFSIGMLLQSPKQELFFSSQRKPLLYKIDRINKAEPPVSYFYCFFFTHFEQLLCVFF